jgi:heat shock protein HslJ
MRLSSVTALLLAALVFLAATGCQPKQEGDARLAAARGAPTLEELRNATYFGLEGPGDTISLRDGSWEGQPPDPASAVRPTASYARDLRLVGDLNGDGTDEAVGFLAYAGGGTGDFLNIAVMARSREGLRQIAATTVGDRVQVRAARIENGAIVLDLVQAGPADAACCPGELATRVWALEGNALVERESVVAPGRLGPEAIGPIEWTLEAWDLNEPAAAEAPVTISWQSGRLAGSTGCNRYSATVKAGELPGDVTIGPAISTRRACPPPEMETERRFLQAIDSIRKIGFMAGRLALTCRTEQGLTTMLFKAGSSSMAAADSGGTH